METHKYLIYERNNTNKDFVGRGLYMEQIHVKENMKTFLGPNPLFVKRALKYRLPFYQYQWTFEQLF